ncbi:hypothetical protein [Serratia sp. M24T3]|nr:hypothetical protein [Serratia sp. M24T3]
MRTTISDLKRRSLMEIIFHNCEFVGEMSSANEARKTLYMEGYGLGLRNQSTHFIDTYI